MNRDEKATAIEEIAAQIEGAEAIFAVDYRGISVPQAAELRSKLRDADASFRVVKNRLTKIAAEKAGEDRLGELLEGPTALTFVRGDTAQAAKTISTFTRENDVLAFKGGFMDSLVLDADSFKSIARLPAREVLYGQFAGVVASPVTGLVRGLGSMIQGLALQLGQIAEKGLVTGDTPAVEEPNSSSAVEDAGAPDAAEDADAPSAGDGEGGTAPEEASATAGGGGSPSAAGPAGEGSEQDETSDTDDDTKEEE